MAEEVGSAAGKAVGKAALKSFINPSTDILKAIPQGIIELSLRGAAAVSGPYRTRTRVVSDRCQLMVHVVESLV